MIVQGFRYDDSPAGCWELSTDYKFTSLQQLLAKFYEEWQWSPDFLGWARDPVNKDGQPEFDPVTNWIVAPCRRRFYITIERQFKEMFGPHPMRLMYRSDQVDNEICWVAICQLNGMWHSDERIKAAAIDAINTKQLYQSERTAQELILV
jgi:hypothetical protein